MLKGEQLHLRLHERKRRAQFVGSVSRELFLRAKPLVKTVNHVVKRCAELLELGQHVFADFHLGQVVRLHLLDLRCKIPQRTQRPAAHEIRKHATQQRNRHGNQPVCGTERLLRVAYDNCKVLIRANAFGVK